MDIRFRLPREQDAESCAALVLDNQPFSQDLRSRLPELLATLLQDDAVQGVVYEDWASTEPTVVGFAAAGFAAPRWLELELADPVPGLVERLYRAEAEARPQLLRPKEAVPLHADSGLNLVFLHYATRHSHSDDELASAVQRLNSQSFTLALSGYFCCCLVQEVWDPAALPALQALGFHPPHEGVHAESCPVLVLEGPSVAAVPFHPFAFLFTQQPRRLRFSPKQQRQLRLALWHLSDEAIAAEMGISVNTVRKRWDEIFRRATEGDPELLGHGTQRGRGTRGPDRRRALLSYLQVHMEELQP